MKERPFFSIIVVSYNAENTIVDTINSILNQTYKNLEIIVKDALSKDDTLKSIPSDDRLKIYSCKDTGIYDGMNQALEYVTGKYINFMNCGDNFHNNKVLEKIHGFITKESIDELSIVYGDYNTKGNEYKSPGTVNKKYFARNSLCHQAMFFSKDVFDMVGKYNCDFRIYGDYELALRALNAGTVYKHVGVIVCDYLGDGVSEQDRKSNMLENQKIQAIYYSKKDLLLEKIKAILTLRYLRILITSDRAPKWLKKIYVKMANRVNS